MSTPTRAPGWRPAAALCLLACGPPMESEITPLGDNLRDVPDVRMSVDAAFQESGWGRHLGRCQLQVAFFEDDEQDGHGMGQQGEVIDLPSDGASSCTLTVFDAQQTGGNWFVRGSLHAGDHLRLEAEDGVVHLELEEDPYGRLFYALPDCDEDTFPFGQLFDLYAPDTSDQGHVEQGFPGSFMVERAVVTGAALTLERPALDALEGDRLPHALDQDLDVAWRFEQSPPVDGEQPLHPRIFVTLRNMREADNRLVEALACSVEGESLTIPAEHLGLLTPSDGEVPHYVAFQVDANTDGPDVALPWGDTWRSRSTVSAGGTLVLRSR